MCGYVNIGHTSLRNVDYDNIDVWCHGGLTYGSSRLNGHEAKSKDWWIGWDYAHFMDGHDYDAVFEKFADDEDVIKQAAFMKEHYFKVDENCHIYTVDEVVEECKKVVEQIILLDAKK